MGENRACFETIVAPYLWQVRKCEGGEIQEEAMHQCDF